MTTAGNCGNQLVSTPFTTRIFLQKIYLIFCVPMYNFHIIMENKNPNVKGTFETT